VDAPYFKIKIHQIWDKLHRDLPPSRLWTYGESSAPVRLEARSHQGVLIDWSNELPPKHFLPLESPMHFMPMAPETRTVVHLHGARVPADSDGYPEDWFGPGKKKLCFYPNHQDAAALWFHDHAMGVNRLNIFAGLMGWYLLRDEAEDNLGLPGGNYELPLLIYDRSFDLQGQLYYPNPPDEGAWAEEFLGDAMIVNGKVQPYHDVEARKYRLRIANTANSRFFSLGFSNGQGFEVIGSDQGLLPTSVAMNRLVLAPAERTDIVVDFSQARGESVNLVSDSLSLMQFRVSSEKVLDDNRVPGNLRPVQRIPESEAIRTRVMTLNEFDSDYGEPMVMLLNRKHWTDPITEIMQLGATEIWSLVNLTEDTHPIHLHMVRFQILDRQNFSRFDYLSDETLRFTGAKIIPAPHEMGWKDVVQCPGGTVTRIIIPFDGYSGKYLWHCHILEHEANDMMRPYEIVV
jgi:spore coat protein A